MYLCVSLRNESHKNLTNKNHVWQRGRKWYKITPQRGTFRIWAPRGPPWAAPRAVDRRSRPEEQPKEARGAAQILNVPSMGCDYNIITYLIKFHCMHGGRTRFICRNAQDCPSRKSPRDFFHGRNFLGTLSGSPRDFFHGRNFLGTLSVSPRNFCHGRNFLGTLFSTFAHGFWTSSMHTMESYQVCNYA